MNYLSKSIFLISLFFLSGCAHLDFGDDKGLTYYDPKPYVFVSTTKDCVSTATVVMVPAKQRQVKFESGYGTADLSVNLSNGMITSVGQKTDTKIPETISSIASLGTAVSGIRKEMAIPAKQATCKPTAVLYPVENGIPQITNSFNFPVTEN